MSLASIGPRAIPSRRPLATGVPASPPAATPAPLPVPDTQRLTNLFLELTQIPAQMGEEKPVADTLRQKLAALGLTAREDGAAQATGGNSGNLIVDVPGTVGDAPALVFMAHMDTVDVAKGTHPLVDNGIIHTDGSTALGADDRAGAAEILEAMQLLFDNHLPHPPMQLIFTVGEEAGLVGSSALRPQDVHGNLGFAVDSFHPNDIFFGDDGGPLMLPNPLRPVGAADEAAFHRPATARDHLQGRGTGSDFVLDFTRDAIRGIGLQPAERSLFGADSDAHALRNMGIPAITIGAGEQDIHTQTEHIAIDDMNKSAQLILQLIAQANQYQVQPDGTLTPRGAMNWNLAH